MDQTESLQVAIQTNDAHAYEWMDTLHIFMTVLIWYRYAHVHVYVQMEM